MGFYKVFVSIIQTCVAVELGSVVFFVFSRRDVMSRFIDEYSGFLNVVGAIICISAALMCLYALYEAYQKYNDEW